MPIVPRSKGEQKERLPREEKEVERLERPSRSRERGGRSLVAFASAQNLEKKKKKKEKNTNSVLFPIK